MTNGLLLGKFSPFHVGHEHLINFARNHCDKLIVMVCTRSFEPIDGEMRYGWIKKAFPDVIVKHVKDDTLPQQPEDSVNEQVFRKTWIDQAKLAADGMTIDYFYASEDYGSWMAEGLNATFVPVDPRRETFSTSGTDIRQSIYRKWNLLPEVTRASYVKRVTFVGPESTGKTHLSKLLAKNFDTVWMPEYGRIYTDKFGGDNLQMRDFEMIRKGHEASVKSLTPKANILLFEDTDAVMTRIWCEFLTGSKWFGYGNPIKPSDFYFVMAPTIEWKQDGTRYFEDLSVRQRMFDRILEVLEEIHAPVIHIIDDPDPRQRMLTVHKVATNFKYGMY